MTLPVGLLGELIINASPAAISNIQIIVKGKSKASKVASAVMSTVFEQAYADSDVVTQNDISSTQILWLGWYAVYVREKIQERISLIP